MADEMEVDGSDLPHGIKRKADGTPVSNAPSRIVSLSQDVINKIAAGEIIVAPVHALKELIENSVDAGSTSIEILVKEGGLKLLQITDNGHGINKEDLPLLCERFATSKLKAFEDLASIGTYGFRGEALASISHIAHLSVTTRTRESSCAWKAHYSAGKFVPAKPGQSADPKPTAGNQGTQITVEDLFYNVPSRRRAFRSSSEEYAKILELVGKYAIHCTNVAFSCKKHGESSMGIAVPASATIIDRIRQVHSAAVANELVEFNASSGTLGFKAEGWISNANYSVKRTTLLLFINHRSVESSPIKKAIEQTYSTFLPKGGHPFVYMSLEIEPHRLDVNVHPTKREVRFLHEDEIIEAICSEIRDSLGSVDTSRTFMTQSLLTGGRTPVPKFTTARDILESTTPNTPESISTFKTPIRKTSTQKPYENNLVRTDSRARKITSMLPTSQHPSSDGPLIEESTGNPDVEMTAKEPSICRLTSIKELRAEVRDNIHNELTDIFASHTFVGIVDQRLRMAAIQGGVNLYLVDYAMVCNEYFYQIGLTDFGNFGVIRFDEPLPLRELLKIGAKVTEAQEGKPEHESWEEVIALVEQTLVARRAMLSEYFSMEISVDGKLLGIPMLVKGYMPCMDKLPQFLLRLGPMVNWEEEKPCFHTFLRELTSFYVPEPLSDPTVLTPRPSSSGKGKAVEEESDIDRRRKHLTMAIENIFFPAFKSRLVATKGLLKGVTEIANLKRLYRVFERC